MISSSLLRLLLGDNIEDQSQALASYSLIRTSCKVALFYNALLYAHATACCIYKDCTLSGLQPAGYYMNIKRAWPDADYADGRAAADNVVNSAISFMLKGAKSMGDPWFGPNVKEILQKLRDAYELYQTPTHRNMDDFDFDQFCILLAALPLLQSTKFDFASKRFVFDDSVLNDFTLECEPFVYFLQKDNTISKTMSSNIMIFVEAVKGERNNQLQICLADTKNGIDCKPAIRRIRRQVPNNESLILLCKKMEIDVQWYDIEQSWCKLAFIARLTELSSRVLLKAFDVEIEFKQKNISITEAFYRLFENTDLEKDARKYKHIRGYQLQNVFYGLFIRCGIFNTMYALLSDAVPQDDTNNAMYPNLYPSYMDFLRHESTDQGEQCDRYDAECNKQIQIRLAKLARIVSKRSTQYDTRKRSIEAEWHAYCILKIVGIQADNLFTDEELMLSIDDYFKMIKNPSTSLAADVGNVLGMLNDFYGALLVSAQPTESNTLSSSGDLVYDENRYVQALRQLHQQQHEETLADRFDRFVDIVKRSGKSDAIDKPADYFANQVVERLLGRQRICDPDIIANYKTEILQLMEGEHDYVPPKQMSKRFIFVSYAHEDKEKVDEYVRYWRERNIRVWIDSTDVRLGDRWIQRVIAALYNNPECAGMVLFASRNIVPKATIAKEVKLAANMIKPPKEKGDFIPIPEKERKPQYPIITINLESNLLETYLDPSMKCTGPNYSTAIKEALSESDDNVFAEANEKERIANRLLELVFASDKKEMVEDYKYNDLEAAIAKFYLYLKYGEDEIFDCFNNISHEDLAVELEKMRVSIRDYLPKSEYPAKCVYPMIVSVKESAIKRDNVAIVCYEMVTGKGEKNSETRYILSDNRLVSDDYYCIPNYRSMAGDGSWMVNPLLINHRAFAGLDDAEVK